MPERNWTYAAQLDKITDGDTVRLLIDNGFYNREAHAIRLKDVNTPEIFTKDAEEKEKGYKAVGELDNWLRETAACVEKEGGDPKWPLILVTEKDKQTFNRYIGDIFCANCGDHLNEFMRSLGYV